MSAEMMATPESPPEVPRIYVASLSDYNAGRLHGAWIDATGELDEVYGAVETMLANSPEPNAEEWAIHDQMGFGNVLVDEHASLEWVHDVAEGIALHNGAYAAWVATRDRNDSIATDQFMCDYLGQWSSVEDYAEQLLDDMGANTIVDQAPTWLQCYVTVDAAAFARDLVLGGDVISVASPEGVYLFGRSES